MTDEILNPASGENEDAVLPAASELEMNTEPAAEAVGTGAPGESGPESGAAVETFAVESAPVEPSSALEPEIVPAQAESASAPPPPVLEYASRTTEATP